MAKKRKTTPKILKLPKIKPTNLTSYVHLPYGNTEEGTVALYNIRQPSGGGFRVVRKKLS